jgi:hypothetical protein
VVEPSMGDPSRVPTSTRTCNRLHRRLSEPRCRAKDTAGQVPRPQISLAKDDGKEYLYKIW